MQLSAAALRYTLLGRNYWKPASLAISLKVLQPAILGNAIMKPISTRRYFNLILNKINTQDRCIPCILNYVTKSRNQPLCFWEQKGNGESKMASWNYKKLTIMDMLLTSLPVSKWVINCGSYQCGIYMTIFWLYTINIKHLYYVIDCDSYWILFSVVIAPFSGIPLQSSCKKRD